MKRSARILHLLLVALMSIQGASLVARCAVPCGMGDSDKLHCVVQSISRHNQGMTGGRSSLVADTSACGRLDMVSQSPALRAAKFELAKIAFDGQVLLSAVVPASSVADLQDSILTRAGPPEIGSSQALLAVPTQNAPPVLV
jgi:hypothetical protein